MSRPRNSSRANILLSEQSFLTRRKPRKSTIMVVLLTTTQTLSTSRSAIVTVTLCHLSTRITEDSVWQLFHTDVDSRYRIVEQTSVWKRTILMSLRHGNVPTTLLFLHW